MPASEELQKLIKEQQKDDDTDVVWPEPNTLSLDAPIGEGPATLYGLVGRDFDGELVSPSFSPKRRKQAGGPIPHGTLDGYNNHRCRCSRCKAAISGYRQVNRYTEEGNLPESTRQALLVALKEHLKNPEPEGEVVSRRPRRFLPRPYVTALPSPYWPEASPRWEDFEPPDWTSFVMWSMFERTKQNAPAARERSGAGHEERASCRNGLSQARTSLTRSAGTASAQA